MTTKRLSRTIGLLFGVCLSANILSACHFGDKPDGLAALAKKKRQLTYSMSVALPSIAVSDSAIVDYGPDGLNVNWDEHEKLAVMGSEFLVEKDTIGDALWPYPEALDYNRYRNTDTSVVDNETRIPFEFSAYAKHGIGEDYATLINVVYPYNKVVDRNGNPLKARVDSIPFTFTGQDGTLATLRDSYYVALGRARGLCTKTSVVLRDSAECLAGHDHAASADDVLLLDPKVAVVRLSLIVPAQDDFTLLDYLTGLNMSGTTYYVDKIMIGNQLSDAKCIGRTLLNLTTGWMEPQGTSATYLMVQDDARFWNHTQIARSEAQSLADVGGTGASWGTLVYVAFPCVDEGRLEIDPLVTVYVNKVGTSRTETIRYYGRIEATTLCDGCYYVTSPIALYTSAEMATEPAEICKAKTR